ncbi:MAG: hypothetical protein FGM52_12315 [Mycobacterium sp.]|nr:hypothetical protein [Mycobacterium sp.]
MDRHKVITLLGSLTAAIGVWFWLQEFTYARENGGELAGKLQWVGVAITLSGIAIVIAGLELRHRSRP